MHFAPKWRSTLGSGIGFCVRSHPTSVAHLPYYHILVILSARIPWIRAVLILKLLVSGLSLEFIGLSSETCSPRPRFCLYFDPLRDACRAPPPPTPFSCISSFSALSPRWGFSPCFWRSGLRAAMRLRRAEIVVVAAIPKGLGSLDEDCAPQRRPHETRPTPYGCSGGTERSPIFGRASSALPEVRTSSPCFYGLIALCGLFFFFLPVFAGIFFSFSSFSSSLRVLFSDLCVSAVRPSTRAR